MKWRWMTPEARLRVGTRAILVLGFVSAIVIFATSQPPPENPLGYDPLDTKKYLHDLEVYGGKANVFATELREWFNSLWHGKRLAFTVAALTLITAGAVKFFAMPLLPDTEEGEVDGGNPSGAADNRAPGGNVTRLTPGAYVRRARSGRPRPSRSVEKK